jgi:hypothetical protein
VPVGSGDEFCDRRASVDDGGLRGIEAEVGVWRAGDGDEALLDDGPQRFERGAAQGPSGQRFGSRLCAESAEGRRGGLSVSRIPRTTGRSLTRSARFFCLFTGELTQDGHPLKLRPRFELVLQVPLLLLHQGIIGKPVRSIAEQLRHCPRNGKRGEPLKCHCASSMGRRVVSMVNTITAQVRRPA